MSENRLSRRDVLGGIATTGVAGVAGCTGSLDGSSEGGTTTTSGGVDAGFFNSITQSHYPVLPYSIVYMIAEEKGYYEEVGLNAPEKIVGSSGGGTTLRNLTSGDLPWGSMSCSATIQGYYSGASVRIIGGATPTIANVVWMVDADTEFDHLRDAKGMSIGYTSPGSTTQSAGRLAVELTDGITSDDVEFKGLGGVSENVTALKQGNVDIGVVISALIPDLKPDYKIAFDPTNYVERYQQGIMVASPRTMDENAEELRRFIEAYDKGCQFMQAAQDDDEKYEEAVSIFAEYNDFGEDYARSSLGHIRNGPAGLTNFYRTALSNKGLARVAQAMKYDESFDRTIEWEKIFDQSLLPESRRVDLDPTQYY